MVEINGTINETRRTFAGDGGETGRVDFGRPYKWGGGKGRELTTTMPIRVSLTDGREGYGKYQGNKSVRLTLKNNGKPLRGSRKQA